MQKPITFKSNGVAIFQLGTLLLIWVYWLGGELALSLEHAPLAWLQSMMLTACAVTAYQIGRKQNKQPFFWYLLAIALLFCALDEKFMFHENAQAILFSNYLTPSPKSAFLVHWLILFYPIVGLAFVYWLRKKVSITTLATLLIATLIGCCAITLDVAFDDVHIQSYEEVLEYVAETLFLIGLSDELQPRAASVRD